MEGVSHEAASLAGTLGLGKMIYFYDDNLISLDGPTELSFTEDVPKRFEAYHWHVQIVDDGNDLEAISRGHQSRPGIKDKPSLIACGRSSAMAAQRQAPTRRTARRWAPEATKKTKKKLGWPEDKSFYVPEESEANWLQAVDKGRETSRSGTISSRVIRRSFRELAAEFERMQSGELADGWEKSLPVFAADAKPIATRNAGGKVMDAIAKAVPELIGGAADLTRSTRTIFKDSANFHLDPAGRNIYFGVREFGMCAAVNGMAVHGGLIPYGSTFFSFSDYCKPALRWPR